ncbi:hypothetical protein [Halomonas sp. BC04]|uniref:hypothetical protein n=1 Tax=Halomonas sp. BC04 TaxID=1403540 RepID=UPI0004B5A6F1|nr:hypothetical protein [Halomonas sp. BC04]
MVRLPYVIAAFELFNLRQEWHQLINRPSGRSIASISSAIFDLTIASLKAMEFYGERHNRLSRLRAGAVSRHLPLGDALIRSQSTMLSAVGNQLRGTITAVNLAGVAAGAASAALLAWDAWTRFQHGNVGAGIALSIASVSTAVVAGSALVKTSPLWLGLGPVGWIALGLSIAAVALSIWLTDNEIEEWLRLGPFGSNERYAWRNDPADAFDRLVSLFANIRIRIEPVGLATAESIAQDSERHPAIGLLNPSRPMGYVDRLVAQQALAQSPGLAANTRVVINSNLPGLAPGWEKIALFRCTITTEKKHEFRKDGYSQWLEEKSELGEPLSPLFERATTDGREYYLWVPEQEGQPGSLGRAERRTRHQLRVKVQWRKEPSNSDILPRALPAPAPTRTERGDPLAPNFERTDQPIGPTRRPIVTKRQPMADMMPITYTADAHTAELAQRPRQSESEHSRRFRMSAASGQRLPHHHPTVEMVPLARGLEIVPPTQVRHIESQPGHTPRPADRAQHLIRMDEECLRYASQTKRNFFIGIIRTLGMIGFFFALFIFPVSTILIYFASISPQSTYEFKEVLADILEFYLYLFLVLLSMWGVEILYTAFSPIMPLATSPARCGNSTGVPAWSRYLPTRPKRAPPGRWLISCPSMNSIATCRARRAIRACRSST